MKQLITILLFLCNFVFIYGQKMDKLSSDEESRFYVKAYLDYGLATPNSFKGVVNLSPNSVIKPSSNGWGQGLKVGIGGAYIIDDFVNLGLDIDYYLSPKLESLALGTSTQSTTIFDGKLLAFTPNITFKAIQNVDFYPYSRVGVTIGIPIGMENSNTSSILVGGKTVKTESIYAFKASPALGYIAALGIRKSINPGFKLFVELQANNITIQPKSATMTKYTENGEDKLASKTISQKEIVFSDTISSSTNTSEPTQSQKTPFLIARLCLQVGFTFRF